MQPTASLAIALSGYVFAVAAISTPTSNISFATFDRSISSENIYSPCLQTYGALTKRKYDAISTTQLYYAPGPDRPWSMLNAYRSGGRPNVHWKYTDTGGESGCLESWKYYASDGATLYTIVSGKTTTARDSRPWCALPVYRSGGRQSKQWDICHCEANGGLLHA